MKQEQSTPITILGAGAWGTALATVLASRHAVMLWGRDEPTIIAAAQVRTSGYLPDVTLPPALQLTADFDAAVTHAGMAGLALAAVPVAGLREVARRLKGKPVSSLIWLCKGFEQGTQRLPHQVAQEELGPQIETGALFGPSFAAEVARGLPCALTIASRSQALRQKTVAALHHGALRIYPSTDVIGVEVGGAVKNIMAIATGIADGMLLGLNARAALITRGLAEISRLGVALGGRQETFMGLTGVGDLILTSTGDLSRNRQVGLGLAQGKDAQTIEAELGHVAEGVRCAQTVRALAQRLGVNMPLVDAVAQTLFEGVDARRVLERLLAREPRAHE